MNDDNLETGKKTLEGIGEVAIIIVAGVGVLCQLAVEKLKNSVPKINSSIETNDKKTSLINFDKIINALELINKIKTKIKV